MSQAKTATLVRELEAFTEGQRRTLWEISPPMVPFQYDGETGKGYRYVVASEIAVETFFFPADSEGNQSTWLELPASRKGRLRAEQVLFTDGYALVGAEL